jgi:hypothetical protein
MSENQIRGTWIRSFDFTFFGLYLTLFIPKEAFLP